MVLPIGLAKVPKGIEGFPIGDPPKSDHVFFESFGIDALWKIRGTLPSDRQRRHGGVVQNGGEGTLLHFRCGLEY